MDTVYYDEEDVIFLDLCDEIEAEIIELFPEVSDDYLDDNCCDIADFIMAVRLSIFGGVDESWDSISRELGVGKKWLTEQDIKDIEYDKMLGYC
jgi:hypothetical protein